MPGVLLTRPLSQSQKTAALLKGLPGDWRPYVAPLMKIVPLPWAVPEQKPQAVLLTSINAVSALQSSSLHCPVYVVGSATQEAALSLGYSVPFHAPDAEHLIQLIQTYIDPKAGPLLYLSGQDVSVDLKVALAPLGYEVMHRRVYRADLVDHLPSTVLLAIQAGDVPYALVYSRRSMRALAQALQGEERRFVTLLCLSPDIADIAGEGWAAIYSADYPTEANMLKLLPARLREEMP